MSADQAEMLKAVRERDRRVAELIDRICRRAGGENEDPPVTDFDKWCEELGLHVWTKDAV